MKKETVSMILGYLLFIALVVSFAYMLIENTRLVFENTHIEAELAKTRNELVDSQNQAWGYKWQLHQINETNGFGGDE